MPRKLIFLVNPISGTKGKKHIIDTITRTLDSAGIAFEFVNTNADGRFDLIEKKITEENIRTVVIIGGDGTVSHVTNALRHLPVDFGIIPTGSGNGLALAAGIPRDPAKALDIIINGRPSMIDAFTINGHFSCMLSGIGFDAKVAHDFARQKKRGLWTYVKVSAANFFNAKTYPFILEIDNKKINTNAYFISIANSNQFGNNFTIAPKASLNDGLVDIVVVQKMNKLQVLLSIIYQIRFGDVQESIFKKHGILYYQQKNLQITNSSMAPLHIDGDPYHSAEKFNIRVIPSAISLIQPG
ncbi:MAG TPA: YegS/Rv2252/BmrU family lipid kinase [Chitinophagaceae bacterium]|nr:YegS/Rv2252/BmrU family lipid kinase [Chitinophagaceae bacterium]